MLRCHRVIKKRSGAREEQEDVEPGSSPRSVGLSVVLIAVPEERRKTKKPASSPIPLPPGPRAIAIFENGLELRGRTPLAEKPSRSFSSGQRRQLYEHESPGETALLTSYLLGSSEGGTNSPFNLTSNPPWGLLLRPSLPFGDKICGYSLFLEHSAGVDNIAARGSFPRGKGGMEDLLMTSEWAHKVADFSPRRTLTVEKIRYFVIDVCD